jgi:hypothetical protein
MLDIYIGNIGVDNRTVGLLREYCHWQYCHGAHVPRGAEPRAAPDSREVEMGILLAFAPFIAFALVDRLIGPTEGLVAGAAVSAALLLRDWVTPGRSAKILEVGTAILFGALALYAVAGGSTLSVVGVRLCVDLGLLAIVLASIALRRPFTLEYAREQVPAEFWDSPQFLYTNYVITAAWALAFGVLVAAELILLYVPDVPPRIAVIAMVIALIAAIRFTSWYPARVKANSAL